MNLVYRGIDKDGWIILASKTRTYAIVRMDNKTWAPTLTSLFYPYRIMRLEDGDPFSREAIWEQVRSKAVAKHIILASWPMVENT
jgi:hypothetical protein